MALLLIIHVLATILTAVLETEDTETVHHVVFPVASKASAIVPLVRALAVHLVQDKIAFKCS